MIWAWALLLLIPGTLWVPLRLRFCLDPFFLEVQWLGLGVQVKRGAEGLEKIVKLLFFKAKLKPKKTEAKPDSPKPLKAKKTKKKPKKKKLAINWAKAKAILTGPLPPLLWARLIRFFRGLFKAIGWERAHLVWGGDDPFRQGILTGALALLPKMPKLKIVPSFQTHTNLELSFVIRPWRLVWSVLALICTLPYWQGWRLYTSLLEPT